jgi:uncharacterized protein
MGKMTARYWDHTPLHQLDRAQWESLCDGCGKCCLHKLEDDETGKIFPTNVACRLLDRTTSQCSDYRNRLAHVPDCIRLTPAKVAAMDWLPSSCAYVLRADGLPLPAWHHLNTGDPESVHRAGMSVRGWTISEVDAGDLEYHVIDDED